MLEASLLGLLFAADLHSISRRQLSFDLSQRRQPRRERLRGEGAFGRKGRDGDGAKVVPPRDLLWLHVEVERRDLLQRHLARILHVVGREDIEILQVFETLPLSGA